MTKTGDRAYGRYQVMGSNIPEWTQTATGTTLTPEQFRASPSAQDAVFKHYFGGAVNQYGNPQDAASVWFSGKPLAYAGNASDGYNTVPQYVNKFNKALSGTSSMADNTQPALSAANIAGASPVLFGGAPTPVGAFGAIGKMLGIGTADELGRHLQNAGAGLISIADPKGGAALQEAANKPLYVQHFVQTTDPWGNQGSMNVHTGQRFDSTGQPIGPAPGTSPGQPSAPPQQQQQGAPSAAASLGLTPQEAQQTMDARTIAGRQELNKQAIADSDKKYSDIQDTYAKSQELKQQAEETLKYVQDPNVYQGTGADMAQHIKKMLGLSGADQTDAAEKGMARLQGLYLNSQKGMRFAGPEIKFGEMANPSLDKTRAANTQILQDIVRQADRGMGAMDIAQKYRDAGAPLGATFGKELKGYWDSHPSSKAEAVQASNAPQDFKVLKVTEPK
jgi:hypothetical protein